MSEHLEWMIQANEYEAGYEAGWLSEDIVGKKTMAWDEKTPDWIAGFIDGITDRTKPGQPSRCPMPDDVCADCGYRCGPGA